jgi:hypothetical protein
MTEAERQAALQCLGQLEQLRVVAAAVSPALEALVAACIAATGCSRAQALQRLGVPVTLGSWAAAARRQILQHGDAALLEAMEATQAALCQSDGPE